MHVIISVTVFIIVATTIYGDPAYAKSSPKKRSLAKSRMVTLASDVQADLHSIQEKLDKLSTQISQIEAETSRNYQQITLIVSNRTYVKGGAAILVPRSRTIPFAVDSGLGVFLGIGQYFGDHHVADFSAEWDFYPSFSLRYRYDFSVIRSTLNISPVVGYKVKIANIKPWDSFVDTADLIRNSFFFTGIQLGIPMNNSMATVELVYLTNQQSWFVMNAGVHFFL